MQRTQQSGWHGAGTRPGAETLRMTGRQEGLGQESWDASQSGLKGVPGLQDQTGARRSQPCKALWRHPGKVALLQTCLPDCPSNPLLIRDQGQDLNTVSKTPPHPTLVDLARQASPHPPLHGWATFSSLYVLTLAVLFLRLKLLLTLPSPQLNVLSSEVQLVHHAVHSFFHKLSCLKWLVQCLSSHNVVNCERKISADKS